ncbi:MAG: penicillin acylase family protein [Methylococcales bacterium]|nr:penicillin acylase family protein [Methylococcales bacterium]
MANKKLKYIYTSLLTLSLIIATGLFYLFYTSLPIEDDEILLPGLKNPVSVHADSFGIPSIKATDRKDAYQVLGFLHARDRLFQMELMRRKSAGRLAEIFGSVAVNLDMNQRDYQFEQTARNIVAALPTDQKQVLKAYVEGVNAFISQAKILPPEFIMLKFSPEPWRMEDSILVALGLFQTLNGQEQDERMVTVMEKALPKELVEFLTPDTDAYATILLGGPDSHRPAQPVPVSAFAALDAQSAQLAKGSVDVDSSIAGSNNWVVAGNKTFDGRAIVANDMHLGLNAPNIWYRAELHYTGQYLNGVTLPGLPLLIVGGNNNVAWGFTNITADLLDLITLDINPNNPQEYLTPQGWRSFTKNTAIIKIKDGADIAIELRSTIWGPVSSKPLLGHPVAIKWIALETEAVDLGLLDMDKVTSVKEAMRVINQAGAPQQNVVFADRAGHIGWTYMGRFPKRKVSNGLVSRSWADASMAWDGFIPPEQLPRVVDPPDGFIVTANNRTLGRDYPYVIANNWALGYRAYRITELLREANNITEQDMLHMQLDTRSEFYEFYRQLGLQEINTVKHNDGIVNQSEQTLRAWDGYMHLNSKGAALLILFREKLAEGIFAKVVIRCKQYDPNFSYAWREMETPLRELLTQRPKGILPAQYNDNWREFILETLNSAATDLQSHYPDIELAQLNWGTINRITQHHPFSKSLPILGTLLDIGEFESSGCASVCVKVMSNEHGASERLVLAPAHPEDGILEMPGGQSGHPFSKHYRDQQKFWQEGKAAPFMPGKFVHTLHFRPI